MPIYEPGLDKLVLENVKAGRLAFTGDLTAAVRGAEAVFIAVGTPTRRGDGHADLTYVYAAAEQVACALTGYAVIVTKSTVPVGTSRAIAEIVSTGTDHYDYWALRRNGDFYLLHSLFEDTGRFAPGLIFID